MDNTVHECLLRTMLLVVEGDGHFVYRYLRVALCSDKPIFVTAKPSKAVTLLLPSTLYHSMTTEYCCERKQIPAISGIPQVHPDSFFSLILRNMSAHGPESRDG